MKLSLATFALSATAASAYNVGGFDTFGRPYYGGPRGRRFARRVARGPRCAPQGGRDCVDRAFEELQKEMKNDSFRPKGPQDFQVTIDEQELRKQQEFVERAFGLASDVAKGMAATPRDEEAAEKTIREQKEWVDKMFGFVGEVSSGGTYSAVKSNVLQDDDQAFQVALDVPGVKAGDIDVTVEGTKDKILVVRGKRNVGGDERKFSKVISLNARSDTEQLSADLENGVLIVSVPKLTIENTDSFQKIMVNKVSEESMSSPQDANGFPFELELDVPGVSASNIDITVEGDTDKSLTITAVREIGKDSEGNPRTKEISKSFKVDELVDTSKIVANLSDGVLKVSAPADKKKTEETVRKIVVKQSSDAASSEVEASSGDAGEEVEASSGDAGEEEKTEPSSEDSEENKTS